MSPQDSTWTTGRPPQVYVIRFWMMLLGAQTPKPTLCYSNGSWVKGLNTGKLSKTTREEKTSLHPVRRDLRISLYRYYILQGSLDHF